jgi:hypothetical protein
MHRESGRCIHPLRVAMLKVERVIGAIIGFAQRMNESGPFRRVRKLRKIISDIFLIYFQQCHDISRCFDKRSQQASTR